MSLMSSFAFILAAIFLSTDLYSNQPNAAYRLVKAIGFALLSLAVAANYVGKINAP